MPMEGSWKMMGLVLMVESERVGMVSRMKYCMTFRDISSLGIYGFTLLC